MAIKAKTSNQAIIDAVNADNLGLNLTLEQVTVGDVVGNEDVGETSITLTSIEGKGYTGKVDITYQRQTAYTALKPLGDCVIPSDIENDEAAIIEWITNNFLTKSPVPMDEHVVVKVNHIAKAATIEFTNHKILIGRYSFNYTVAVPDLDTAVANKKLASFTVEDVKP